jgi:DNA (cytosine-5)-methyltransferase 1
MKYGSVCSGIEAATMAWHSLGWKPQWFSEIEPFPSAVLQHHYPETPNLGDMTLIHSNPIFNETTIDVLVGGTPCQSFSVAGLRKGMEDPRGNLALEFCRIADKAKPQWIVWENVPGVLSSNGGKDFGSLLGALGELGYGFAYRVLDAQHFGVAQRRRRIFLIGYLGDWRPAAAVLFESESLCRDIAESRGKRQKVTREIKGSVVNNSESGEWWDGGQTAASLTTRCHDQYMPDKGHFSAVIQNEEKTAICFKVRGGVSENSGIQGGVPGKSAGKVYLGSEEKSFTIATSPDQWLFEDKKSNAVFALAENTIGRQPLKGGNGDGFTEGGPMYTLNASGVHGVAVDMYNMSINEQTSQILSSSASDINHTGSTIQNARVRRLTPVECERLQGFPEIKKYTIFDVCLDHQNNYVNVAIKCRKLQNNVFNAEEVKKQELAKYAVQNLNAEKENQKSAVVLNVQNNYGPKLTNLFNVEKLLSNAISAETKKKFLQLMETESFAQLLVDISTIAEKIIETGKVELQVNPLNFTWGESGNLFAEIFGREKEGFAKDVESIAKEAITFITLNLDQNIRSLNMKNLTWLFSVLAAINLFIAEKTLNQSSFEFCITTQNGFTNIPYRKKEESPDGPRYKALGNSMAVPVMAWIGKRIQEVSELINEQNDVNKK